MSSYGKGFLSLRTLPYFITLQMLLLSSAHKGLNVSDAE